MSIDWTKPVETIDGLSVRILETDADGDFPITFRHPGSRNASTSTLDGRTYLDGPVILRNVPEPKRRIQGWVNVYADGSVGRMVSKDKEQARSRQMDWEHDRIACIYIDVEEGEGL